MAEGERCLSVHEPQASLLCYGIKRFEGRGWNTHYRGRLWIHSTAKKPAAATIQVSERRESAYARWLTCNDLVCGVNRRTQ